MLALALAQLPPRPPGRGSGRRVLVRADTADGTNEFVWHLHQHKLAFSVGLAIDTHVKDAVRSLPQACWRPAITSDGSHRHGAWVAEATGYLDLSTWPPGTRAICRKELIPPGFRGGAGTGSRLAGRRCGWRNSWPPAAS